MPVSALCSIGSFFLTAVDQPLSITLGDQALLSLVILPCVLGFLAGASPGAPNKALLVIAIIETIGVALVILAPHFPASANPRPGLITTGLLWLCVGCYTGVVYRSYRRTMGLIAYWYTCSLNLVAISLSQIVSAILPGGVAYLRTGSPSDTGSVVSSYVPYLALGLAYLLAFGWRLTARGVKTALKQLLFTFTLFGVVSFVLQQFYFNSLYRILWWIPLTAPTLTYQAFATTILAMLAVLPLYNPSENLFRGVRVAGNTAIGNLIGSTPATPNAPLQLIHFTCQSPQNWIAEPATQSDTEYGIMIHPPHNRLLLKTSTLGINVYEYQRKAHMTNEEQLKFIAQHNLRSQGATLLQDQTGTRTHRNLTSYECEFKKPNGYGMVVCFAKYDNLFVISWFSFWSDTFRRYRYVVDDFIDSIRF